MSKTTKTCIYCGGELRRIGQGEHIIPKALGGSKAIRCVCHVCNNAFSVLDQQLIACSPIHFIDYRVRMPKGGNWYDIDHDDDNLVLEAYPDSNQTTTTLWPQIIFCERGTQMRVDHEELEQIGAEVCQDRFFTHLCAAYERHKAGEKRAILFSPNPGMSSVGRYPPRVFAEKSIREFEKGMRFRARYEEPSQRITILDELDKITPRRRFKSKGTAMGSSAPGGRIRGDAFMTYRALTKIAINALAYCCEKTQIDRYAFREAIRFVRHQRLWTTNPKRFLARCGFVPPEQLESLGCPKGAHLLHLCHYAPAQLWQMYFSLFGGDVGGRIEFPGPSQEAWRSTTIIAPLRGASKAWKHTPCQDVVAPDVRIVAWTDEEFLRKVVPSVASIQRESGKMTIRRCRPPR